MNALRHLSLCFDLDGTIVDTAPDLVRVLNDVIAEEDLQPTDYAKARAEVGYGSRRLILSAFERAKHSVSESRIDTLQALFLKLYADDIAQLSQPFPGVLQTLIDLRRRGASLSICTNKPGYLARPLLEELGMSQYFTRIVGSDDVERNKPYADHIFAAVGHRGRHSIVMVGDSLPDVLAAKAAKVPVIIMNYGYSPVPIMKLGADRILRNFREIPSALSVLSI